MDANRDLGRRKLLSVPFLSKTRLNGISGFHFHMLKFVLGPFICTLAHREKGDVRISTNFRTFRIGTSLFSGFCLQY